MKKLFQIVDTVEYVKTNCYQHQLLYTLSQNFEHKVVELANLTHVPNDTVIFCSVKIRNVYANIEHLARVIGDRHVFVYDQDTWESFIDTGGYVGKYALVAENLKNSEFVNTSKWWTEYVRTQLFKSNFCRMWALPEYCSVGEPFSQRDDRLFFRGQLHPFRKKCNDELLKHGLSVEQLPNIPFRDYVDWLGTVRLSIHDESDAWTIGGKRISKQCAVPKDVEIMSQGTFVLRDSMSLAELKAYEVFECPLLVTYETFDDVRDQVNRINSLDAEYADKIIKDSVEYIHDTNGWMDFVKLFNSR